MSKRTENLIQKIDNMGTGYYTYNAIALAAIASAILDLTIAIKEKNRTA